MVSIWRYSDRQDTVGMKSCTLMPARAFPESCLHGCVLKTPYRDGATHVIFDPLDFIARLAARVAYQGPNVTLGRLPVLSRRPPCLVQAVHRRKRGAAGLGVQHTAHRRSLGSEPRFRVCPGRIARFFVARRDRRPLGRRRTTPPVRLARDLQASRIFRNDSMCFSYLRQRSTEPVYIGVRTCP